MVGQFLAWRLVVRILTMFVVLMGCLGNWGAVGEGVYFERSAGCVGIKVGAQVVAEYCWDDPVTTRPFFSNVLTRRGAPVTRTHPPDAIRDRGNEDHAGFHPGIWLAFGELGGADFWRLKARVRQVAWEVLAPEAPFAGAFGVTNHYEAAGEGDRVLAIEECRYLFVVDDEGYFLLARSVFRPVGEALLFGDQEEMGLGIRLATGLSVRRGGGLLDSAGGRDESGTWGRTPLWCAGFGSEGGRSLGALLMPGPGNFRKSWFHNRDYGLMVANPFGKKAMTGAKDDNVSPDQTKVPQGEVLRLDFGVYIFDVEGNTIPDATTKHARFVELLAASE